MGGFSKEYYVQKMKLSIGIVYFIKIFLNKIHRILTLLLMLLLKILKL